MSGASGGVGSRDDRTITVGIDVRKIRDYGIGRYVSGLLRAFAAEDRDDRFVLFASPGDRGIPDELREALPPDRFAVETTPAPLYSVRELLAFRGVGPRFALDLLHFPHYVRALAPGCPVAVTLHDAIHLSHPPSRPAYLYARAVMSWSVRTAACALTVSCAARSELAQRLRVPEDRFRVTPNGVDDRFTPPSADAVATFRARRGLVTPFVLCMASHRPHKNLRAAVTGFASAGLNDALLVVPARDEEAAAALQPWVHGPGVQLLLGVPDADLPLLYAAARIVLCPSLAEGFGLPGIEAAACGAAVMATSIPAHVEILGDAAAYAPAAGSPDDLAAGLRVLWADEAMRADLARRGLARAAGFRWDTTVRLTREAYRSGIEASGRRDL